MRTNEDASHYTTLAVTVLDVIMTYIYFINLMPVLPSSCVSVLLKMSKNIKYIIIYVNVILLDKFSTNF